MMDEVSINEFHMFITAHGMDTMEVERALALAVGCHHNELRKDGKNELTAHILPVAKEIALRTEDEFATCVALLHDTTEDGHITLETVTDMMGEMVSEFVGYMDKTTFPNKHAYIKSMKEAPPTIQAVKIVDIACNLTSQHPNTRFSKWYLKYARQLYPLVEHHELSWILMDAIREKEGA